MTDEKGGSSLDMVIGEVRGQLREMIHNVNNIAHKQDLMFERLMTIVATPAGLAAFKVTTAADLAEIKTTHTAELTAVKARLDAVEKVETRRQGAIGIAQTVFNSRAFGWIVGGATTVYFLISGRLHL